jgi:hypothetical protein
MYMTWAEFSEENVKIQGDCKLTYIDARTFHLTRFGMEPLFYCDHFLYGLIFWISRKYGFESILENNPHKVRDRLLHCTQSWTCTPSSKGEVWRCEC